MNNDRIPVDDEQRRKTPNWGHVYEQPTQEWLTKVEQILKAPTEDQRQQHRDIMKRIMHMSYGDALIAMLDIYPDKLSEMERGIALAMKNSQSQAQ